MRLGTFSIFLLSLAACGGEKPVQTPYGSVREVEDYLKKVDPFIREIGKIHQQYELGLATAGASSEVRRGTGQNLAEAAEAIRPRLRKLLGEFEDIEPPPLLAPFHRDTKQLIVARLDAYGATINGRDAEESSGDFDAMYRQAEAELKKANDLILRLNSEMEKIIAAVERAREAEGEASS